MKAISVIKEHKTKSDEEIAAEVLHKLKYGTESRYSNINVYTTLDELAEMTRRQMAALTELAETLSKIRWDAEQHRKPFLERALDGIFGCAVVGEPN